MMQHFLVLNSIFYLLIKTIVLFILTIMTEELYVILTLMDISIISNLMMGHVDYYKFDNKNGDGDIIIN